jgi:citrate synthase
METHPLDSSNPPEYVNTRIWQEEQEPGNEFATRVARCHGYDVYGEMLGRASWADMIYLLFRGQAPTPAQAGTLDALAVALANAGPRDAAVHAAMAGGVGGSTAAACLIAALAVGAGQLSGGREVFLAMKRWQACGLDVWAWHRDLRSKAVATASVWPAPEHPPGFDPHAMQASTLVLQTLDCLAGGGVHARLSWLQAHREALEEAAGCPLAMTGVAAAALADLGFSPDEGEMMHLMLRLPGAAVHALEQRALGHRQFPFFTIAVESDAMGVAA